jgi:cytochrome c2
MLQHELLMLVAAPLLVLGRPVVAVLFAFHRDDARSLSRLARGPRFRAVWRAITHPLAAWAIHAFALWLWHIPLLFDATLRHEWVHHAQHLSFFGSALLFWWSLLHARAALAPVGAVVLYLFTTMMHTGLLGALILFADTLLYPGYLATAADWGLTPLEDQQLGGLLMWAPGGLVYVAVALALLVRWLRRPEAAASRSPRPAAAFAARALPCLAALLVLPACTEPPLPLAVAGGDPQVGRRKTSEFGCGACHSIPGIAGATTRVGPPLEGFALRNYIGGVLPNDGENLVRFLLDPLAHNPRSTMPKVLADEQDARDIAAYLHTLR